jgi:hypothetical protein
MFRDVARWIACVLLAGCATSAEPAGGRIGQSPKRSPALETPADNARESERSIFPSMLLTEAAPEVAEWVKASSDDREFASRLDLTLVISRDEGAFGEVTRRQPGVTAVNGEIRLGSPSEGVSPDAVTDAHLASSFLIDFDEPSVEEPVRALTERFGATPSVEQVEAFTNAYIERKTSTRFFDTASQVASHRAGDCSEHAVLLVALLRRSGIPSRVVLGMAIIGVDDSVLAMGHAWVEYHTGDAWRRLDAALYTPAAGEGTDAQGVPGLPAGASFRRAYLPLHVMTDEGHGYGRVLVDGLGLLQVRAVRVGLLDAQGPR